MKFLPFLLAGFIRSVSAAETPAIAVTPDALTATVANGAEFFRYQRTKPADSPASSPHAGYFHPLRSPKGVALTAVGPDDHPHHRGVFLAWVNMQGATPADYWGWGALAPKDDRTLVNRSATSDGEGAFTVVNDWLAKDQLLVTETLKGSVSSESGMNVVTLVFTLLPKIDFTLPRGAFSGFCVRTLKPPGITAHDPAGPVSLADPHFEKPETDWQDRPWYAFSLPLEGDRAGVAVLNHPANPPTLWHNITGIGMINPCIHAPSPVELKKGDPLVLRYRIATFDGAVPTAALDALHVSFAK